MFAWQDRSAIRYVRAGAEKISIIIAVPTSYVWWATSCCPQSTRWGRQHPGAGGSANRDGEQKEGGVEARLIRGSAEVVNTGNRIATHDMQRSLGHLSPTASNPVFISHASPWKEKPAATSPLTNLRGTPWHSAAITALQRGFGRAGTTATQITAVQEEFHQRSEEKDSEISGCRIHDPVALHGVGSAGLHSLRSGGFVYLAEHRGKSSFRRRRGL
ncbi:uncharacterized protein EKO05_0005415 [Ascochyta rabiei]|uniref:uncharacterized protein n=1 Tax=Didymella rabiei TaxID=5454 RepID=UPI00220A6412|nr:uncharacterized protein EKO05_0005415 [Ascochyta rabiei]UPX14945.1 hypothetical protein EKO05_0005415 [Ascochyta rabiei]